MAKYIPAEYLYRWFLACVVINMPILVPAMSPPMQLAGPGLLVACCYGTDTRLSGMILATGAGIGLALAAVAGQYSLVLWLIQGAGLAGLFLVLADKGASQSRLFLVGTVFLCITFCIALFLASGGNLPEAYAQMQNMVSKDLDHSLALYRQAMASPDNTGIDAWMLDVKKTVLSFLPGIIFCMFVITSFSNLMIARWSLRKKKGAGIFAEDIDSWYFPDFLIWGVILAGAASLFGSDLLKQVGDNMLLGMGGLYSILGLAIISRYFKWLKLPGIARGIFYLLILIQWYGLIFVALLGIFDTWFDFRSRIKPDTKKENTR